MGTEYVVTSDGEMYHWGIKGMKWGVRRYQNTDGSLTAAGIKRYYKSADNEGYKNTERTGARYKTNKKGEKTYYEGDAEKWVATDRKNMKRLAEETKGLTDKLKNVTDKSIRNQPKTRLDLSKMSDKELRDQINRELLERQYNDVFNPPNISKGKQRASEVLDVAGDMLGITASALGIALAIQKLRRGIGD